MSPSKDILRARFSSTRRHFETRRSDAPARSSRQSQRGRPGLSMPRPNSSTSAPAVLVQRDSDFLRLVPKNKRKELAVGNVNFPRRHKIPLLSIDRAVRRLHLGTNPKSWGARNATIRHGRLHPAKERCRLIPTQRLIQSEYYRCASHNAAEELIRAQFGRINPLIRDFGNDSIDS